MTTLYEILGVTSDATLEAIRKAYKKLAQKLHPDKGGDPAAFRMVKDAYEVLSDKERRKQYDRNGDTDPIVGVRQQALGELAKLLKHVIQNIRVERDNPIEAMISQVVNQIADVKRNKELAGDCIRKNKEAAKRLKVKKGQNIISQMLSADTLSHIENLQKMEAAERLFKEMKCILEDYEYTVDKPMPRNASFRRPPEEMSKLFMSFTQG